MVVGSSPVAERHVHFSIATFGFGDQPQKINQGPSHCKTNRVSKLTNIQRKNYVRKKLKYVSQQYQAIFTQPKAFKFHSVNWSFAINRPCHFTCTYPLSVSSTGANISSTEKGVLQWSCDTRKCSLRGTPLMDEKFETLQ